MHTHSPPLPRCTPHASPPTPPHAAHCTQCTLHSLLLPFCSVPFPPVVKGKRKNVKKTFSYFSHVAKYVATNFCSPPNFSCQICVDQAGIIIIIFLCSSFCWPNETSQLWTLLQSDGILFSIEELGAEAGESFFIRVLKNCTMAPNYSAVPSLR